MYSRDESYLIPCSVPFLRWPSRASLLPLYRPRDPQASDLWRLRELHFESFRQVYDERFAAKYGF